MQRIPGCPSFCGSIYLPRRCFVFGHPPIERLWRHHPTQSTGSSQVENTLEPDHTHLIDPSSLRNTLEAVREANRATLIKKVDEDGKFTSLQLSNGTCSTGILRPSWVSDQINEPESLTNPNKAERSAFAGRRKKPRRKGTTPELRNGDYAGIECPVQAEWRASSATGRWRRPWMAWLRASNAKTAMNAKARLGAEIKAFTDYFTPGPHETRAVETALGDIKAALNSIQTSHSIELMGSRATGLASPLSDLDLNLTSATGSRLDEVEDRAQIHDILRKLSRQLHKSTNILRIHDFVGRARVPIVSGVHQPTTLEFQIQCTASIYNSTEYAKTFLKEYPTLRSLFLVIKQMLFMRGLCEGPWGGLTSYPLLNMIVACLKLKCAHLDTKDVAGHLVAFLDMYSDIDFYNAGISVLPPAFISLSSEGSNLPLETGDAAKETTQKPIDECLANLLRPNRRNASHRMYLIDPADPSNDLGSGAHMIKHIQATLIHRRVVLRSKMQAWESTVEPDQSQSLLACLLEGDYKTYELDRASLERDLNGSWGSDKDGFASNMDDWNI